MKTIFITGGTGYIGQRLINALLDDGSFQIRALARKGSESRLPAACTIINGDALDAATYVNGITPADIFIHLIGVAHPAPSKKEQFRKIDLVSVQEAAKAASAAGIKYFVYLSVAMYPSGIMNTFQEVRAEGEKLLSEAPFTCLFVRPWYVLGPGHYWPLLLKPLYWLLKKMPAYRQKAEALDTVGIQQLIGSICQHIKNPPASSTTLEVSDIKKY